ncbi:hypothetical protein [Microbacterium maritypicum]
MIGTPLERLTDEQDIEYNEQCTAAIRSALLEQRASGIETPLLRTFYPNDDETSADIVSLDRDDNVVILDPGSR